MSQYELRDGVWVQRWMTAAHKFGYVYALHVLPPHVLSGSDSDNRVALRKIDTGLTAAPVPLR